MSYYPQKIITPLFTVGRYEPSIDKLAAFFQENKHPLESDLEALAKESNISMVEIKQYYDQHGLKDIPIQNHKEGKSNEPIIETKKPRFTVKTSASQSHPSSHIHKQLNHEMSYLDQEKEKENKKIAKSITQIPHPQLNSQKDIKHFLSTMDSTKSLDSRINIVSILVNTKESLLSEFSTNKLLGIISDWVHDCKDTYLDESSQGIVLVESLITLIISLCQRMTISYSELKKTKIGKNINKFGKLCTGELNKSCLDLVQKWKKMIDNYSRQQEKEANNNNSDDEYLKKKTRRDNNYNDHNGYYTNDITSQSISMNKKYEHYSLLLTFKHLNINNSLINFISELLTFLEQNMMSTREKII